MTEEMLCNACKKLHFSSGLVEKAKKIKAKNHLEFLLELFNSELEERDIKRRNACLKSARFDVVKTFENYDFKDIKFPRKLCADDLLNANFIPKKENLILYGNIGAGKTHLAVAVGIAACNLGFRVRFWRVPELVNALIEAKNHWNSRFF